MLKSADRRRNVATGVSIKLDKTDRRALARMTTKVFQHWNLTNSNQLAMLGLSNASHSTLSRYRHGAPMASNRDLLERAGHILSIHKSLRLIFPQDRDLAYAWMTQRNQAFHGKSPVEVISEWGVTGLLMVRTYLDRNQGH